MENVKGNECYSQHNTSNDVVDNVELYDTEDSNDDKDKVSQYKIVPQPVVTSRVSKRSNGWTKQETVVLLEAWGENLLKNNRKKLLSEEWYEVADKVSKVSQYERTKTHCRNRMDTLRRYYKKEITMLADNVSYSPKWPFFKKMDMIVSSYLNQKKGKQIVNSKVYPSHADSDEMEDRLLGDLDSPKTESDNLENLPSEETKLGRSFAQDESDNLENSPPKKTSKRKERSKGDPFGLLADCINKFSNTYNKVESFKSNQLVELEKWRMNFRRDVGQEKRKIWKESRIEIAKIWGVDIEDKSEN